MRLKEESKEDFYIYQNNSETKLYKEYFSEHFMPNYTYSNDYDDSFSDEN